MICVFDCETIPDVDLLRRLFGYEGDDEEVAKKAIKIQEEKTGSGFLPLPFHKVVAISAVIADDFGIFSRVSSIDGESEKELVRAFLDFIDKHNPKLISFNGRSFDMPMLMIRAMAYNLSCPAYFETNNNNLGKNKWEHYRARFSDRFHIDVMDHLSDFGAARGLRLDYLCAMAGLPGKYDIHGDEVMSLFFSNELDKIRTYCESDALNTYWLYLKYELLKGNLTLIDYAKSLQKMDLGMDANRSYAQIFKEQITKELTKIERSV
ncbi:MAG: 3'-5' exonuclease [Campylobacteraceae bacterium]|nr:3'-5' exonuclease [Campylobacteraceae bacterium]